MAQKLKRLPGMWETWVRSLGWEDPLEKETATHSSTVAWRIPWTVACQAPLSMEVTRVGHDLAAKSPPPIFALLGELHSLPVLSESSSAE